MARGARGVGARGEGRGARVDNVCSHEGEAGTATASAQLGFITSRQRVT